MKCGNTVYALTMAPVKGADFLNLYGLDITLRKRTMDELCKSQLRLNSFMDSATDGFILFDSELNYVEINQAAVGITNLNRNEILGKNILDVIPNLKETGRYDQYREVMRTGVPLHNPDLEPHPRFGNRHIDLKAFRVGNGLGMTFSDVTAIKRAEHEAQKHREEMLHMSRLSTVGEMASGLAHELNQPLCSILTHANVCLRTCETEIKDIDRFRDNLRVIASQSKRAGEIVNRIKDFVKKRVTPHTKVNINDVVHETVRFTDLLIQRNHISLDLRLDTQLPFVLADPIQIEQVLINLACNAIESMQKVTNRQHRLIFQTLLRSDSFLEVSVSDTGEGLPDSTDKLFEPFYTTKQDGLGIGLSISHSIVEAHGGTLCAETNLDSGCTFKVALPIKNVIDKATACE